MYILNVRVGYGNKKNSSLSLYLRLGCKYTLSPIDARSFKAALPPYQDGGSVDAFVPIHSGSQRDI